MLRSVTDIVQVRCWQYTYYVQVCQWQCDTFTTRKSGIILILCLFSCITGLRDVQPLQREVSLGYWNSTVNWNPQGCSTYYKCWCHMNMIVAYDINRYSLLSDNKYYIYRTFPYTSGTNAMCIFYKFKYMCNQLVLISKGEHCVLRAC